MATVAKDDKAKLIKTLKNASLLMEQLLENAPDITAPKPGTIVDGKVVNIHKNKIA